MSGTGETGARWYVVRTHARQEQKALFHLRSQGFEVYLPQFLKRRRHARKTDYVKTPLFPRYMFVRLDLGQMRWRPVLSTIGVSHLVGNDGRPSAVPVGLVEDIRAHEGPDGTVPAPVDVPFEDGQAVRIESGAFASQVGFFKCLAENDRVALLLDMLGRKIEVRVPVDAVSAFS